MSTLNISVRSWRTPVVIHLACLLVARGEPAEKSASSEDKIEVTRRNSSAGWTEESSAGDVVIHSRVREGAPWREFRGVATIEAPPAIVFAVIDDAESYASFMPYTAEVRVLKRGKDWLLAYQRLELPMVSDRDYTVRSRSTRSKGPDGVIYRVRWTAANEEGPAARPGVQRVNVCEGEWLLEPDRAGKTRATYIVFSDSGGAIPPFIANSGSRVAIRKVFEAIRKQANDPKYASAKTAPGEGLNTP